MTRARILDVLRTSAEATIRCVTTSAETAKGSTPVVNCAGRLRSTRSAERRRCGASGSVQTGQWGAHQDSSLDPRASESRALPVELWARAAIIAVFPSRSPRRPDRVPAKTWLGVIYADE